MNTERISGACLCGKVTWTFAGEPGPVTACSCTACRRYGALWAYDWEGERITTSGETRRYMRGDRQLGFHFCPDCGCVVWWRGAEPHADGRRRIAVNVRMAAPEAVAQLPVKHFDGLNWQPGPEDGRCVRDMWF